MRISVSVECFCRCLRKISCLISCLIFVFPLSIVYIWQTLRRGIAAARPMSKNMQLSPAVACRTIISLPNLPEDEGINWSKEIYGAHWTGNSILTAASILLRSQCFCLVSISSVYGMLYSWICEVPGVLYCLHCRLRIHQQLHGGQREGEWAEDGRFL